MTKKPEIKPRVLTFFGTRPEIIKLASLFELLDQEFDHIMVHSGQHYSKEMDRVFFEDLSLRQPDYNLGIGSHAPATQVARMLSGLEEVIVSTKPELVIVQGDTNTTLAGALTAIKQPLPRPLIAHVEALVRSNDLTQVEEVNRRIVDSVSDILFAVDEADLKHLTAEGLSHKKVHLVGNTLFSTCRKVAEEPSTAEVLRKHHLEDRKYVFVTCHRQENVDVHERLLNVLHALDELAKKTTVFFAVHPRTKTKIEQLKWSPTATNFIVSPPLSYRETIALTKHAALCITDSGGLLEESAIVRTPAVILRDRVEQKQIMKSGIHELCFPDSTQSLVRSFDQMLTPFQQQKRRASSLDLPWNASLKIVEAIKNEIVI